MNNYSWKRNPRNSDKNITPIIRLINNNNNNNNFNPKKNGKIEIKEKNGNKSFEIKLKKGMKMKKIQKIKNENKRFVNKTTEKGNKKVSASKDLETAEKSVRAIDDQCIKVIVLNFHLFSYAKNRFLSLTA